jgi:hypothetical protein
VVASPEALGEPPLSASSLAAHVSKSVELNECPYCVQEYAWRLDTKYYTANLKLWVVPGDARSSVGDDPALRAALAGACATGRVQGVLLACHPNDDLDVAAQWADLLQTLAPSAAVAAGAKAGSGCGAEFGGGDGDVGEGFRLQLLVAVGPEGASFDHGRSGFASEASRVGAVEWGLDRAYELVEINLAASLKKGHAERDKDGVPRVVEAAEATPWSNLARKATGKSASSTSSGSVASLAAKAGFAAPPLAASAAEGDATKVAAWHASCTTPTNADGSESPAAPPAVRAANSCTAGSSAAADASFACGDAVVVVGLVGAPQHNGSVGTVVRFDPTQGRFVVRLALDPKAARRAELGWEQLDPKAKRPVLAVRGANLHMAANAAAAAPGGGAATAMAAAALSAAAESSSSSSSSSSSFAGSSGGGGALPAEAAAKEVSNALTARLGGSSRGLGDLGALEQVQLESITPLL